MLGRQVLQYNADVEIGVCLPEREAEYFFRDGEGDEVIFVHEGEGVVETIFGELPYRRHDYIVIPRGTTYRFRFDTEQRWLTFYTPGEIETPNRYRNRYGQLLEHAPFSQRDFHPPAELRTHREGGTYDLKVRVRRGYQDYVLDYHPFDVVGWDGYVYPYTFNIADFEPKAGRLHQPPPAHQTFQGPNFVICSFCPRMLDWDDQAVPLPYHHSNVQSEEVMYYVDGDYAARKGVDVGTFTLHPSGLPHGPQPGTVEKALGREVDERARRHVRHVPAAQADGALARPRRPVLRVLVVGVPGDGVAGRSLTWRDGERVIAFGRGRAAEAVELAGGPGFALLTTERALAAAPALADAAAVVHHVGQGTVPPLAAAALDALPPGDGRYVALGGGRVVDVAKAVAAARGAGARALAVPTTLSGAELTSVHRHAEGVDESTPRVRCALVVCDPALAASQPEEELAASALNALAHAAEAPCTVGANPVSTLAAHDGRAAARRTGWGATCPTATRWRSAPCSPGTRWTRRATGCTTCWRRRSSSAGSTSHGRVERGAAAAHARGARLAPPARSSRARGRARRGAGRCGRRGLCARTGATRLRDLGIDERGARRLRRTPRPRARSSTTRRRAPIARSCARSTPPPGEARGPCGPCARDRRHDPLRSWRAAGSSASAGPARPGRASSRPSTRARAGRRSTASRSSRASCAAASSPRRRPASPRWTPTR